MIFFIPVQEWAEVYFGCCFYTEVILNESTRQATADHIEIKLILNEKVISKLDKLRGLLLHKHPNLSYSELIDELTNMAIKKLDPEEMGSRRNSTKIKSTTPPLSAVERPDNQKPKTPTSAVEQPNKQNSRYIPAAVKRAVWKRDKGQCVFKESENHEQCGSRFQFEYHHEIPFAKGGRPLLENIELYCKRHNTHRAITDFAIERMQEFAPRSVT